MPLAAQSLGGSGRCSQGLAHVSVGEGECLGRNQLALQGGTTMSVKTICSQATRSTLTLAPRSALLILLCSSMLLLSTVDAHASSNLHQPGPKAHQSARRWNQRRRCPVR